MGLLTVAALLPEEWEQKLIDLNVAPLHDQDLAWADYVFLSAMVVQKDSVKEIITRCQHAGVKIVAGGPLFTAEYENFNGVDHFVLNEAEITLPAFVADLKTGHAQHLYTTHAFPDITSTPIPRWDLLEDEPLCVDEHAIFARLSVSIVNSATSRRCMARKRARSGQTRSSPN